MQLKPVAAIIVLLLVITSLLIAGCTSNNQTNTQSGTGTSDKTTFSSDRGYSITYPTAWKRDVSTNASSPIELYLYLNRNETADGVIVATKSLSSGQTASDFANSEVKLLKNYSSTGFYKDFKVLSETDSTIGGKPAHTIIWSGTIPIKYNTTPTNTSVQEMQTYVVNNNMAYVITYKTIASDYNTYLAVAQEAINSFTVTTPVVTPTPASTTTVSFNATSLGSSNTLSSSYGTPTAAVTGNKFVTYAVYLQNINAKGTDNDMGNPYSFKLRDTNSNIYSYDSFTYSLQQQVNGVTLKGLTSQSNTQPGDKYSGLIAFQIPTSATPKTLTYDDYTNKITVNL
jgi:hypothetical protein